MYVCPRNHQIFTVSSFYRNILRTLHKHIYTFVRKITRSPSSAVWVWKSEGHCQKALTPTDTSLCTYVCMYVCLHVSMERKNNMQRLIGLDILMVLIKACGSSTCRHFVEPMSRESIFIEECRTWFGFYLSAGHLSLALLWNIVFFFLSFPLRLLVLVVFIFRIKCIFICAKFDALWCPFSAEWTQM